MSSLLFSGKKTCWLLVVGMFFEPMILFFSFSQGGISYSFLGGCVCVCAVLLQSYTCSTVRSTSVLM